MRKLTLAYLVRLAVATSLLIALMPPHESFSDDAVVLPKGLSRIFVDTHFYLPFDQRYDAEGNAVQYAAPFNTQLNSILIPSLAPLNAFVPGGVASFGQSNVSINRHLTEMIIQPAYGLTDRLSVGVNIPYFYYRNDVNASVNSAPGSGANIGFNPAFPGGVAPLGVPGTQRATTQDIQNLLRSQFGIKPVQTWEESGIGDIEVGGRYQYYRGEDFRAAFTGGVRFPTGKVDDPDNLVDSAFGRGAYALLFQFQQDWMHQKDGLAKRLGFPDPAEWFINTTFRYDWNLPTTALLRVCPGGGVFCNTKDNVQAKYGDQFQAEISGKIGLFIPGLNLSPLYQYSFKFKDHYSGDKGLDYGSLNQQLDNQRGQVEQHIFIVQLTYTTLPMFIQKQFPFPLVAQLAYRDRFAGSGGTPNSRYIGFTFQAFF
jgi:hypothetical protein